jgi:hypothetical protein
MPFLAFKRRRPEQLLETAGIGTACSLLTTLAPKIGSIVVRDACAAGGRALAVAGDVAQQDEVAHIPGDLEA